MPNISTTPTWGLVQINVIFGQNTRPSLTKGAVFMADRSGIFIHMGMRLLNFIVYGRIRTRIYLTLRLKNLIQDEFCS